MLSASAAALSFGIEAWKCRYGSVINDNLSNDYRKIGEMTLSAIIETIQKAEEENALSCIWKCLEKNLLSNEIQKRPVWHLYYNLLKCDLSNYIHISVLMKACSDSFQMWLSVQSILCINEEGCKSLTYVTVYFNLEI
jgi:hypothetical protein